MKKEIKDFIKSDKQILEIDYKSNKNILYKWPKFRNIIKFLFNSFIIKISKYLPMHIKNINYRLFLNMNIGKNVGISPEVEFDYFYP
jgi:hypothetical protein